MNTARIHCVSTPETLADLAIVLAALGPYANRTDALRFALRSAAEAISAKAAVPALPAA
jgi:Arc/MetJ-type ribon-helix-helix transcriptional regulator